MSGNQKTVSGAMPPDGVTLDARNSPGAIRLLAEELAVTCERVETGRVRVQVVTHTHEEHVDVPLTRDGVEVERVAINRLIDAVPPTRQEGDTIIVPVVHETLVLERRLILKEELHVRLVHAVGRHQERVILRRQEAVVTRIPAEKPEPGPKGE